MIHRKRTFKATPSSILFKDNVPTESKVAYLESLTAPIKDETIIPMRRALKESKDVDLRIELAIALGYSENKRAIAALKDALISDENDEVREYAALGLGDLKDNSDIPALKSAMRNDPSEEVRHAAEKAAKMIGGEIKPRNWNLEPEENEDDYEREFAASKKSKATSWNMIEPVKNYELRSMIEEEGLTLLQYLNEEYLELTQDVDAALLELEYVSPEKKAIIDSEFALESRITEIETFFEKLLEKIQY